MCTQTAGPDRDEDSGSSHNCGHLVIKCHRTERAVGIVDVIWVHSGHLWHTPIFSDKKEEVKELLPNTFIKHDVQSVHGYITKKPKEITLKGVLMAIFESWWQPLVLPKVDMVVQSCSSQDVESYIHSSGRIGRTRRTGVCIYFFQHKEEDSYYKWSRNQELNLTNRYSLWRRNNKCL